ncbi:MAG: tetratricopeptide repeat protein [Hyphomicrobiaceae bacterium]
MSDTALVPRRAPIAVVIAVAASAMLGGCAGTDLELPMLANGEDTASAASERVETASLPAVASDKADAEKSADNLHPAIAKARELRAGGDKPGALAVLDEAARQAKADTSITRERGLLALELGRIEDARRLLKQADDKKAPDWRIKSALGSAHAAAGDFKAAAAAFDEAQKLAPNHPSILNNMALALALEGRHKEAEPLLRRAAAARTDGERAKQNLALILGLSGNIDEARKVSEAALPKPLAAANVSYLERLRTSGVQVSRARRESVDESPAATQIGALENQ